MSPLKFFKGLRERVAARRQHCGDDGDDVNDEYSSLGEEGSDPQASHKSDEQCFGAGEKASHKSDEHSSVGEEGTEEEVSKKSDLDHDTVDVTLDGDKSAAGEAFSEKRTASPVPSKAPTASDASSASDVSSESDAASVPESSTASTDASVDNSSSVPAPAAAAEPRDSALAAAAPARLSFAPLSGPYFDQSWSEFKRCIEQNVLEILHPEAFAAQEEKGANAPAWRAAQQTYQGLQWVKQTEHSMAVKFFSEEANPKRTPCDNFGPLLREFYDVYQEYMVYIIATKLADSLFPTQSGTIEFAGWKRSQWGVIPCVRVWKEKAWVRSHERALKRMEERLLHFATVGNCLSDPNKKAKPCVACMTHDREPILVPRSHWDPEAPKWLKYLADHVGGNREGAFEAVKVISKDRKQKECAEEEDNKTRTKQQQEKEKMWQERQDAAKAAEKLKQDKRAKEALQKEKVWQKLEQDKRDEEAREKEKVWQKHQEAQGKTTKPELDKTESDQLKPGSHPQGAYCSATCELCKEHDAADAEAAKDGKKDAGKAKKTSGGDEVAPGGQNTVIIRDAGEVIVNGARGVQGGKGAKGAKGGYKGARHTLPRPARKSSQLS